MINGDDDPPAVYILNGLVRSIEDENHAAARSIAATVDADWFEVPHERDLYRALVQALELHREPASLHVQTIIKRDNAASSPVEDVLSALFTSIKVARDRPWHSRAWIEHATERLRTRHAARLAREVGARLIEAAEQELNEKPEPSRGPWEIPVDSLADVERLARELRDAKPGNGRPAARGLLTIIDNWAKRSSEKLVATGFEPVDRAFGGGFPVGLHGIAAAPGVGKSALALQLALGAMLRDPEARVLWFRGEMTDDLLLAKALAAWSRLRTISTDGPAPAADLLEVGIRDALRRSPATKPVRMDLATVVGDRFVSVDPPLTPSEIDRRVEEHAPALVVVDYLQLVEVGGFKDRRAELDHVVRRLAATSTRHDLPIVVVSAVAKGTNTTSDIGTLTKESNALDFQAHTFVSLWPEGRTREERTANPRRITMRINKSRTAQLKDEELCFDGRGQFYARAAAEQHEEFAEYALS